MGVLGKTVLLDEARVFSRGMYLFFKERGKYWEGVVLLRGFKN